MIFHNGKILVKLLFYFNYAPLHLAAIKNCTEIVKLLLSKSNININILSISDYFILRKRLNIF